MTEKRASYEVIEPTELTYWVRDCDTDAIISGHKTLDEAKKYCRAHGHDQHREGIYRCAVAYVSEYNKDNNRTTQVYLPKFIRNQNAMPVKFRWQRRINKWMRKFRASEEEND